MALQSAFTLTANEIYNTLANMIISQQVFADNISKHQTLVDKARVDGGLYGDTKLYYATDVLKSVAWGNDAEASNLLSLDRAEDPEVQAIKLDIFRQIRLTVDNYLTKRAFADEGTFSSFNSVMLGWMQNTKKIYDGTLYNVFIGTTETNVGKQIVNIDIDADNNSAGENIAKNMADLFTEMSDYTRDYNDYGNLHSFGDAEIKVIWNAKYFNQVKKIDLPSIFHDDALQSVFAGDVLPARYFGTPTSSDVAAASNTTENTYRAMNEKDYELTATAYATGTAYSAGDYITYDGDGYRVQANITAANNTEFDDVSTKKVGVVSSATKIIFHVFPGDYVPTGVKLDAGTVYTENDAIICKVVTMLPPYMSAFETGTSFFNPRSLTENHYLTFGHNTLQYLKNYPFITVKAI